MTARILKPRLAACDRVLPTPRESSRESAPLRGILAVALALALVGSLPLLPAVATGSSGVSGDVNRDGLVVIAVVDSGINPYHDDFSADTYTGPADLSLDPIEYLPRFPGALRLDLSLSEPEYDDAVASDAERFESIEAKELYWIPGTKIVGAYDAADAAGINSEPDDVPILDEDGHGTKSASVAVGNAFGLCPECLLVVVEGFSGLAWATRQPWIDIVSNSWGPVANHGAPGVTFDHTSTNTRRAAERGQTILFAAGNGVENGFVVPEQTWAPDTTGPDWVVVVGGAIKLERGGYRPILGTGHPVDVIAQAAEVPAADAFDTTADSKHSGTSAATPAVAGALGHALSQARIALGSDVVGQPSKGTAAAGTPVAASPALSDGRLTREELWRAVYATAQPTNYSGVTVYPTSPPSKGAVAVVFEGYGVVDRASAEDAVAVLLGDRVAPARPDEEFFFAVDAAVRDGFWGAWDRDGDGTAERAEVPLAP